MSELPKKKKEEGGGGAPGWMTTFADLMSLLLTFFVLILSFAEVDASKFKRVMGAIKLAFGVQKQKIYEFIDTTSNPFEQETEQKNDSDNVIEKDLSDHVLTVNANELCGMEEKQKEYQKERNSAIRFELMEKLSADARLQKYFRVLMDENAEQLRVGFKPDVFFAKDSSELKDGVKDEISHLFENLTEFPLEIRITNQGDIVRSNKDFTAWRLGSERSLKLALLTQELKHAAKHNVTVKSMPYIDIQDHMGLEFAIELQAPAE